ncbi:hypothetical protein F0185_24320 [Massilia sp. CCM 8692]|uniref:Uncharacterized protein n=1 Tax=Massilia rubra TaxID=2607910 RepID=A0ABX0LXS6_9BURK|nr:hypothetical protein [Massilia rubra]
MFQSRRTLLTWSGRGQQTRVCLTPASDQRAAGSSSTTTIHNPFPIFKVQLGRSLKNLIELVERLEAAKVGLRSRSRARIPVWPDRTRAS